MAYARVVLVDDAMVRVGPVAYQALVDPEDGRPEEPGGEAHHEQLDEGEAHRAAQSVL